MTKLNLSELSQACFEGIIPSVLATSDERGVPNATWLTHVARLDGQHIALSCQFFRKTAHNLLANPQAQVLVVDPGSYQQYRLSLLYRGMQKAGALFDSMYARIQAIADATHMSDVFALESVALFEVSEIELIALQSRHIASDARERSDAIVGLARLGEGLALCRNLAQVTETGLELIATHLAQPSLSLYIYDASEQALYALASRGLAPSGVGASVPLGVGIVGTSAKYRMVIHIPDLMREVRYGHAMREQHERASTGRAREIPLPQLDGAHSSLAIPLMLRGELFGVLWTLSRDRAAFREADVPILQSAGQLLAQSVALCQSDDDEPELRDASHESSRGQGRILRVRYYYADDSIFLDDEYLVKGVSGRVLWLVLRLHLEHGRTTFSNRELRLHPDLKLPGFKDNLETRLLMLQRRLEERACELRIHREQRGRLQLSLNGVRLQLESEAPPVRQ